MIVFLSKFLYSDFFYEKKCDLEMRVFREAKQKYLDKQCVLFSAVSDTSWSVLELYAF